MDNLRIRGNVVIIFICLIFLVLGGRLFSIQVLSDEYARKAESYVIRTKSVVPPRGNIFNKKGEIYVSNRPMFTMTITPDELYIPDTSILINRLDMSQHEIDSVIARANRTSRVKESIFARYIEPAKYGELQELLWEFRGISFHASNKRFYKYPVGAHILGYISEVNPQEIKNSGGKYKQGDFIGKSGIERSLDTILRGVQGQRKVLKDVHNREVGPYADGKFDIKPVKGKDILLGIDTELQAFGEEIMANKKGSIVAIEPATGEILAFISSPTYKPSILTGKELRQNWRKLQRDTLYPLFNRPLMAEYPPGSIFKLPLALAALDEGVINPDTYYRCGGGFWRNKGKPGCRLHPHPLSLGNAIRYSCNSYFSATYMDFLHHPDFEDIYEGFERWSDYMGRMGIGRILQVDMPYEKPGQIPAASMYDNEKHWYGHNRWSATTIISNAIGQGEILMTPLQMANMTAIIANRGKYLNPHFLRATRKEVSEPWKAIAYDTLYTGIDKRHFEVVIDAMEQVVANGTAPRAFIEDIPICGKTGTVENPHGENHSVFVAFAPKDRPQIAIAVVIENAGGGGRWAAPAASMMIEKYLRRELKSKKYYYDLFLQTKFKY